MAKLADARDLKSRVSKETYRFDSGPGHHLTLAAAAILVQPRLHGFAFRLCARDRIMAEIMAVLESGLPKAHYRFRLNPYMHVDNEHATCLRFLSYSG